MVIPLSGQLLAQAALGLAHLRVPAVSTRCVSALFPLPLLSVHALLLSVHALLALVVKPTSPP